jgi:aldehyde dehydrogenase (NAD+)
MGNESVVVDNTKAFELENIERIFQLQTENRWNIANTTSKHRIDKLKKFHASILSHQDDLRNAMYKDFKKVLMKLI